MSDPVKKPAWKKALSGLAKGLFMLFCIIMFFGYLFSKEGQQHGVSVGANKPVQQEAKADKVNPDLRMVQAERIVKEHLKDPKSATFRGLFYSGKAVCGEVNSKNSFGGYAGYQKFVNRGRIAVLEDSPEFAVVWNEFCVTAK